MSMCFDQANHRVFVGSYSGEIFVVDVMKGKLSVVHMVKEHKGAGFCLTCDSDFADCVRSLAYYPRDTYLFSGCFDSSAYVWAVGPPGKEKAKFRAVAALKNGPNSKIKAIVYCTAIRMIITGHDNGLMAFWSTTTGSVEFVLGGHAASIVELKWFPDTW